MDDSGYSDLGAGNAVDEGVGIAGKDQFARGTRFWYSSQQRKAGEQFNLGDDVIHYLFSSDGVVG